MKLIKVRVKNFRSIEDSEEFEISDLTCLVGKNESGKTALLNALYGMNPFRDYSYDITRDYPRRHLARYNQMHANGRSKVVTTWWELSQDEMSQVEEEFGTGVLSSRRFSITAFMGTDKRTWNIRVNEKNAIEFLVGRFNLNAAEKSQVMNLDSTETIYSKLDGLEDISDKLQQLKDEIGKYRKQQISLAIIDHVNPHVPPFFYTSHYERMSGEISLNQLRIDQQNNKVSPEDQIFLDFLQYAGTSIDELLEASRYEELKAQCEGASNDITDEIFEFWSQNEALAVQIELGEGKHDDEPPFNEGTVVKIRIENKNHRVSVPLSERSAGFVWFFSFLSQFKQLRKQAGNAIILLDEPGLTLHGKAQSDLLRYIVRRLLPDHQVIYSTHSPFMIPTDRLADVRVVEDVIDRSNANRPEVKGTKVTSDVLSVDKDTLFPLQGHLGYEITQSLFIGKNTLLVEGPSDILYLQSLSLALKDRSREGLSESWTICPTGGIDKILPFASLFGGNKLNVAVLCDLAHGGKKQVERLRESEILKSEQVYTIADFTGKSESDVEDIFCPDLYCKLLNRSFALSGENRISAERLAESEPNSGRVVKQAENVFNQMPPNAPEFDHYTPANWLLRNPDFLEGDNGSISRTLDVAEKIFVEFNKLLSGE